MFATFRLRLALTLGAIGLVLVNTFGVADAGTSSTAATYWVLRSPSAAPSPRVNAAMVYDDALRSVVLFGGSASTGCGYLCSDTWLWNGVTWAQQSSVHPPPARQSAAIAYDSVAQTVVLFGGYGLDGVMQDTWILNRNGWFQAKPSVSPPARGLAQMANDRATGSIVLFGGIGKGGTLGDTWIWHNGSWTQQNPSSSPSPRYEHSVAYDSATSSVVLFGGISPNADYYNDTWTWNGSNWSKQSTTAAPSARGGAALSYDDAIGSLVLFGGLSPGPTQTLFGDTWAWDGHNWTLQSLAASPPAQNDGRLAYDTATRSAILFGGCADAPSCATLHGDTWVLQTRP